MAPQKGVVLAKTNFPLYTIRSLDATHFVVAGGGGPVKTGVENAIEIYCLKMAEKLCVSNSVCRLNTEAKAVMNSATYYDGRNHTLAVGMDDECHIYSLKYKVVLPEKKKSENVSNKLRKRKGSDEPEMVKNGPVKTVTFDIQKLHSIDTGLKAKESFQNVVQFSPDGRLMFTGGTDGMLRAWKHQDVVNVFKVKAHTADIDDIAVSPTGNHVVTISKDNCGYVWNAKDGKKHMKLHWTKHEHYRFRACRFGLIENDPKKFNLYTLNIPSRRAIKLLPCYITKWNAQKYIPSKIQNTGNEILSAFAVSDDGTYLGIGMISGSVSVYISFSLQRLYHVKESHRIFITGVEFMPSSESAKAVTGGHDFTLLSISPDYTIKIHQEPQRGSYSILWVIIGFSMITFFLYWLLISWGL